MSQDSRTSERAALFAEHRAYLFAAAYRMLGIAEDAEDVLQDAWLRFAAAGTEELDSPRAYLVTVVTRLAIDFLRSARHRREEYVGVWLPEPVPTREALPDELLEKAESVSFAFLLLLERLSPLQRAVLVLFDVLEYTHEEIGAAIGRTPAASRQILRRARQGLGDVARERGSVPTRAESDARELAQQLSAAAHAGDVDALLGVLAPDVVLMSDGGGRVSAVRRPVAGSHAVSRFLSRVRAASPWDAVRVVEANGQPALLVLEHGHVTNAFVLETTRAGVTAIYVVRNPDKLDRFTRLAIPR